MRKASVLRRASCFFLIFSVFFALVGCSEQFGQSNKKIPGMDGTASTNEQPVINKVTLSQTETTPNTPVQITVQASDRDSVDLNYFFSANGTITRTSSANVVFWTPPPVNGPHEITVTVTDGHSLVFARSSITIVSSGQDQPPTDNPTVNHAPAVSSVFFSDTTLVARRSAIVSVEATDEDGDALSYSFEAEGTIEQTEVPNVIRWTPPVAEGMHAITITVRDAENATTVTRSVQVVPNTPPVIEDVHLSEPTVTAGQSLQVTVRATDSDGDTLAYLFQAGGSIQETSDPFTIMWTPPATPGTHVITVKVSDADTSVTATRTVAVQEPKGLVGYWSFNENSGATVPDSSNYDHDGTLVGAVSFVPGVTGNAVRFDGSTSYFDVPSLYDTRFPRSGTLAFWVKGNIGAQSLKSIIDGWDNTRPHLFIRTLSGATGRLQIAFQNDMQYCFVSEPSVAANTWAHIAVTWDTDSKTGEVYVNGSRVYSNTITDSTWMPLVQKAVFGKGFAGDLDEIRLYNYVVSASEIQSMAAIEIPQPPLPAGFLRTSGTQLVDEDGTPVHLRGVGFFNSMINSSPDFWDHDESDFIRLADWGANHVRFYLNEAWFWGGSESEGYRYIQRAVDWCRKYNIYLILNIHYNSLRGSWNTTNKQRLVDTWKKISRQFKDEPMIAGYDLLNEPWWQEGADEYWGLMQRITDELRAQGDNHVIVVENYNNPDFVRNSDHWFRKLNDSNVMYSFHFYAPIQFTHQGWSYPLGQYYPGTVNNRYYDINDLREFIEIYVNWAKANNVPLYCGEFGAVPASPVDTELKWVRDTKQVLDGYNNSSMKIAWSYHEYRSYTASWDDYNKRTEFGLMQGARGSGPNPASLYQGMVDTLFPKL